MPGFLDNGMQLREEGLLTRDGLYVQSMYSHVKKKVHPHMIMEGSLNSMVLCTRTRDGEEYKTDWFF